MSMTARIMALLASIVVLIIVVLSKFNPVDVSKDIQYGDVEGEVVKETEVKNVELSLIEKSIFGIPFKEEHLTVYFVNGEAKVYDKPKVILIGKGDKNVLEETDKVYPEKDKVVNQSTVLKLEEDTYKEFFEDYVKTFKRNPNKLETNE